MVGLILPVVELSSLETGHELAVGRETLGQSQVGIHGIAPVQRIDERTETARDLLSQHLEGDGEHARPVHRPGRRT